MAIVSKKLTKVSPELRTKLEAIKADPDFVDFLLGWYGLLPMSGHIDGRYRFFKKWRDWSAQKQRQRKRALQKEYGENWKKKWEEEKALASSYQSPAIERGLFSIETRSPPKPNRPFQWRFWFAVGDIKTYLTQVSKRPNWGLIAEILFPGKKFNVAQAEWARRQESFSHFDNERRLSIALRFYEHFKPVIVNVLQTGIPIWAPPHREECEKLTSVETLEKIFPETTVHSGQSKLPPTRKKKEKI
jgi:hypothetical protein